MTAENMTVKTFRAPIEALDEVERELNVRARCFPRWIQDGRMSRTDAVDRLDRLATAFNLLNALLQADPNASAADVLMASEETGKAKSTAPAKK